MGRVALRTPVPQAEGAFWATREDSGRRLCLSCVIDRPNIVSPEPNKALVSVTAVGVGLRVEVGSAPAHPAEIAAERTVPEKPEPLEAPVPDVVALVERPGVGVRDPEKVRATDMEAPVDMPVPLPAVP